MCEGSHGHGHVLSVYMQASCAASRVGNLGLTLPESSSDTSFSGPRNSSFLTQPARSCSLKCWISWQVLC